MSIRKAKVCVCVCASQRVLLTQVFYVKVKTASESQKYKKLSAIHACFWILLGAYAMRSPLWYLNARIFITKSCIYDHHGILYLCFIIMASLVSIFIKAFCTNIFILATPKSSSIIRRKITTLQISDVRSQHSRSVIIIRATNMFSLAGIRCQDLHQLSRASSSQFTVTH